MKKGILLVSLIIIFFIMLFQMGVLANELVVTYKDGQNYCLSIFEDGHYRKLLTSKNMNFNTPRWSPDGKKILYYTPAKDLMIVNTDGTENRSLFRLDNYFGYGFSADPKEIIVGSDGRLALFNWHTNSWRTIIKNSQYNFISFDLAPNGRTIVFSQFSGSKGLYTCDLTTGKIELLYKSDGAFLANPDWSPDGNSIVYVYHKKSFFGEKIEIHVLDIKTKQSKLIVKGLHHTVNDLKWLARTNEIIFVSEFTKKNDTNIFLVRPNGRHLRIIRRTREIESGIDLR